MCMAQDLPPGNFDFRLSKTCIKTYGAKMKKKKNILLCPYKANL